jgi:hypothetical protein
MRSRHGMPAFSSLSPLRVFLFILAVAFAIELGVMTALPFMLPDNDDRWLESILDACLLTVV